MADTSFGITAGSGTLLHTATTSIGGSTVHDQVIKLGPPYLASYTVATAAGTDTAASHILQLMAGASLNVYVVRVTIEQRVLAGSAAIGTWQLARLTTAGTGGTVQTPVPLDTTDAAVGAAGMQLPTSKGTEGSNVRSFVYPMAAAYPPTLSFVAFEATNYLKPIRIPAGTANGLAVKCETAMASGLVNVQIDFFEANF